MTNDIAQINPDMSHMACWTIPQLKSIHFDDFPIASHENLGFPIPKHRKTRRFPPFHLQEQVPVDVAVHPGSLEAGGSFRKKDQGKKNMKWFYYYGLFHMFYYDLFIFVPSRDVEDEHVLDHDPTKSISCKLHSISQTSYWDGFCQPDHDLQRCW